MPNLYVETVMLICPRSYLDCFKGTVGVRLLTGCLLQGLQQLTGVNFIFYYGTQYFENAGFENPFVIQVITKFVFCRISLAEYGY